MARGKEGKREGGTQEGKKNRRKNIIRGEDKNKCRKTNMRNEMRKRTNNKGI